MKQQPPKVDFDGLTTEAASRYVTHATYLIDNGYIQDGKDPWILAKRIFESDRRAGRNMEQNLTGLIC